MFEHFPLSIFFMQKLTHQLFLYSPSSAACSITVRLSPSFCLYSQNPAFIFYCVVAAPANPAQLQPWGEDSFPPTPLLSPWCGDSFIVLLQLAISSHYHCVPEFTQPVDNREREKTAEYQWHNYSRLWRLKKKKELEDCEHWWAERRRLSSFTHPSLQASECLLLF